MKIKRFVAKSMRDAIRQVRDEQGPHAVILSNRRVPGGVEVVAATDYDAAMAHQAERQRAGSETETGDAAEMSADATVIDEAAELAANGRRTQAKVLDRLAAAAGGLVRGNQAQATQSFASDATSERGVTRRFESAAAVNAPATAEVNDSPKLAAAFAPRRLRTAEAAAVVSAVAASQSAPSELAAMQQELGSMRRLIEEQLSGLFWNELKRSQPQRAAVMMALSKLGLDADLSRSIADALPPDTDRERARFLPLGLLANRIPIGAADPILDGGIVALVGPTGVGKTTTIAKLAARFARHNRPRDIALVTLDHYRIGAQEQLFSYGRLLGVPVHSLSPDQDLPALLQQLSDHKLILIDTAGMSQRDATLMQQINRLKRVGPSLRSYVVLAANAASSDEVVRRFAPLEPAGCVLTKIDEATTIGAVLSATIRHALSIAYVSEGQRVPEDLQLAQADQLVLSATQLARNTPKILDDEMLAFSFANPIADPTSIHA